MAPTDELAPEDRAACAVCADWLASGALWSQAGLLAMLGLLLAAVSAGRGEGTPALLAAGVVLGLAERGLALRVAFDARLFRRLATGQLPGLTLLDGALQQVLQVPAAKAGRPLAPRIAGARRLYRAQVVATLLLVGLNLPAWWGG